jgi:FkbM family methyltransferase
MTARQENYDIWRILSVPREQAEGEIRAHCANAYLGGNVSLCRVLGRYRMYVDTTDYGITPHLMLDGYWEMWVTEAMMRTVRRGSVVADIGANLGYFSLLLADLVGPEGKVLAFEANPHMAELAYKSIDINGFGAITDMHSVALGAGTGFVTLSMQNGLPGGASANIVKKGLVSKARSLFARRRRGEVRATPHKVAMRAFDGFDRATDVEFIKMDVEGFEPLVWEGMTKLLDRNRPLTIFIEFRVSRLADPGAFWEEFEARGFAINRIDYFNGIVPTTRDEIFEGSHEIDHMLVLRR